MGRFIGSLPYPQYCPGTIMIRNTTESLQIIYAPIRADMEQVESLLREQFHSDHPFIDTLAGHGLRLAGKRLRPALVLLAGLACGSITDAHRTMAAVVEMLHTATLVHDDVLDESKMRRHTSTLNTLFDNETAVLFGDYLLARAIRMAMTVQREDIPSILADTTQMIVEGELRQVGNRGNYELTEAEYESIIRGKTAALCACCARLGAVLAQAGDERVSACHGYAESLGMAFQIADDVLDLRGSESEAGKSLGTDIEKRKTTLPLIHLLRTASETDRREIDRLLAHPSSETRMKLLPWFRKYRSGDYARERADAFITDAFAALDQIDRINRMECEPEEARVRKTAIDSMRKLAEFTVRRRH
ncbi:MAG: polyprenyl synthetase family protein [Planctomycetia bacterium]|nr:polyprenyl synthetase family protein [Planctomycetia bacterium]